MRTFDLHGPLPEGTTLLEASAGTGKTYTVAALVTRYVAETELRLDELLVITFGRAASQELRERVRGQLVEAERAFAAPDRPHSDLVTRLLDVDDAQRALRHRRLRDAIADIDRATIATTHQFCQLVLRSLGVAGDTDAGATLVESLDELVVEVVDDLYLQRYGRVEARPPFDRDTALRLGRTAVGDPQATIAPAGDARGQQRVEFAEAVRAEMERRKRRLGLLSYDDLLSRLATALEPPDSPARDRMRQQWKVVLVDEFQDTDPVQWEVLDRAFTGHATMVLIGDPKQAIYGFRGGDVVTYLQAARGASSQATLSTNRRSDEPLVCGLNAVLGGAALGDPAIVVHPVDAAHPGSRLRGAPHPAPLRIRQVRREGFTLTKGGLVTAGAARAHIAADCASDIAELLSAGASWCDRPLRAGDVAVIVAARDHGVLVQRALHARGVQAVMAGGGDVLLTPAADDWLSLLEALESPHRSALVHCAALTPFFGLTAERLDGGGELLTAQLADTLRDWALVLRGRGVAALVEAIEAGQGLSARVLGRVEGERLLTDLRHVAQLLHETAVREGLGLTALLEWFRAERRRTGTTERPRRLDSDEAAVQILTVHGSKGLEFPITYLPFAYQAFSFPVDVALFHDREGHRTIDVTGDPDAERAHRAEECGEELRDLYVALTRAQSQVVLWWAPTLNTPSGGLHRMLFGRRPGEAVVPDTMELGSDEYAATVLGLIEELGGPAHEVSEISASVPPAAPAPRHALSVRAFERRVDTEWRRTSYSGLIRIDDAPHTAHVTSEPEEPGKDDEASPVQAEGSPGHAGDSPGQLTSPMATLPMGAGFGSLVHAVLEHTDPRSPDGLEAELLRHATEQLRWWPVEATAEQIATALAPMHRTALGPLADGLTLGEIGLTDRLRELDFEFPLAGGDHPAEHTPADGPRLRDLAPLLRRHLPDDDPLAPYAERVEAPVLGDQVLRGYLSGSVDVVLRLPSGRFVVVDYKTNFLGTSATDYAPELLADAMLHSHYPLQAMLYSVVVHRFLRWRLPGYDAEQHLGGVLYLYVRGMCGPDSPEGSGVFSWRPPAALVLALSDLLDGAR